MNYFLPVFLVLGFHDSKSPVSNGRRPRSRSLHHRCCHPDRGHHRHAGKLLGHIRFLQVFLFLHLFVCICDNNRWKWDAWFIHSPVLIIIFQQLCVCVCAGAGACGHHPTFSSLIWQSQTSWCVLLRHPSSSSPACTSDGSLERKVTRAFQLHYITFCEFKMQHHRVPNTTH